MTLQRILAGTSVPDDERLLLILNAIGATEAELLAPPAEESAMVEVPIYGIDVAAGSGRFLTEEARIGTWPFPRAWLESQFGRGADLAIVRVAGDSQEPELRHGDSVMIDLNTRGRRVEGMSVVRLDDALLIKRVQLEGGQVRLMSNNQAYQDVVVDLDDRFEIIGRAVWASKLL